MLEVINGLKELEGYKYTTISGLNEGEKSFLPFLFGGKNVVICNNLVSLEKYKKQLNSLNKKVLTLEEKIPLMFSYAERNLEVFKNYSIVTSLLAKEDYDILLLTPESLFQKLPNKDYILSNTLKIEKNKSYNFSELTERLISMGYIKQDLVNNKGEFAVRGDIIDIFAY